MFSKFKIVAILILTTVSLNSFGGAIDSLKKEYLLQKNETEKAFIAGRIINFYLGNEDSARFYAQKLLPDFKKTNNKFGEAIIYQNLGGAEVENSNYSGAIKDLGLSIALFKDLKNDTMIAASHMRLGFAYYTLADYESAIKTYLSGIDYATRANNLRVISWGYNLTGLSFYAKPNPDYKKALYYYFKAYDIEKKRKRERYSGLVLMRIGSVYTKLEDYSNADYYLNRALKLGDSLNQIVVIKWSLEALTTFYRQKHEYQKAVEFGKRSLAMSVASAEYPGIVISYRNIAENYLSQKNSKEAVRNIDSAISYSLRYNILQTLPNIYEVKSEICEQSSQPSEALAYYKKANHLKDSLFSVQNSKNINELETKFESKEKEKEITFLNKEKQSDKKIKVILTIAFLLALLSMAMIVFFLLKINGSRKQLRQQNEIIETKQKEILDSIRYAKRIQMSLLPSEKYIEKGLKSNNQKNNNEL